MQTSQIKINLPQGVANLHTEKLKNWGYDFKVTDKDSIDATYSIDLDGDYKGMETAIDLINLPDSKLTGGAASIASIEASLASLVAKVQKLKDAIIRKNMTK